MKNLLTWLTGRLRFGHDEGVLRQVAVTLSALVIFTVPLTAAGLLGLLKLPKFLILGAWVLGPVFGLIALAFALRSPKKREPLPGDLIAESRSDSVKGILLLWPIAIFGALIGVFSTYMSFSGETPYSIIWVFVMFFFLVIGGAPGFYWIWRRRWVSHDRESKALELGMSLSSHRKVETIPVSEIEGLICMRVERGMITRWFVSVNVRGESAPRRLLDTPYLDEAEEASKKIEALMAGSGKKIPVTMSA